VTVPRNKQRPLTIKVRITGVRETLAAFKNLPKDATAELRTASGVIAGFMANAVRSSGLASSTRSALLTGTVKVARDRVPAVQVGGSSALGSRRTPAWKMLFGDEFGAKTFPQFRPHRGTKGYWVFSSIEGNESRIDQEWNRAADEIVRRWSS
jgi:hypothetical protein